jgi:hypothetical protein
MLSRLKASSFSTGVESDFSTAVQPASTFLPNPHMIDIRSSSFEPITRYTEPRPDACIEKQGPEEADEQVADPLS